MGGVALAVCSTEYSSMPSPLPRRRWVNRMAALGSVCRCLLPAELAGAPDGGVRACDIVWGEMGGDIGIAAHYVESRT